MLPTDAKERKGMPITRGVIDYFPDALAEIATVSLAGNKQHYGPDAPLHWEKNLANDHADCIVRHLIDRGKRDKDGMRHSAKLAWRALALLQIELDEEAAKHIDRILPGHYGRPTLKEQKEIDADPVIQAEDAARRERQKPPTGFKSCHQSKSGHSVVNGKCRYCLMAYEACLKSTIMAGVGWPVCTLPPSGWRCTRGSGHSGPCAAEPTDAPPNNP